MARKDVIVVGGGVIGCAVAFELARRSIPVLLLDKSLPGRASSASAGGLWPIGETVGLGCGVIYHTARNDTEADSNPFESLEVLPDTLRDLLVASNDRFPRLSEELLDLTGIDIEYDPGAGLLFLIYNDTELALVQRVSATLPPHCKVEFLNPTQARRVEPQLTGDLLGAAFLQGEHQVNPMLLTEAFKRAAIHLGATFRHDCQVKGLVRRGDRIVGVQVNGELLEAKVVVNAAGAWAGQLAGTVGLKLPVYPVRGQVVLTEALPRTLEACLSTSACYLTQKKHGEVFVGSTTEFVGFDVSVTAEHITSLCRGAVRAVPTLREVSIKRIWSGLRPGTPDELPVLGPVSELSGYHNATGGFRTGIVAAPLTACMVAKSILNEQADRPIAPFLASRFLHHPDLPHAAHVA